MVLQTLLVQKTQRLQRIHLLQVRLKSIVTPRFRPLMPPLLTPRARAVPTAQIPEPSLEVLANGSEPKRSMRLLEQQSVRNAVAHGEVDDAVRLLEPKRAVRKETTVWASAIGDSVRSATWPPLQPHSFASP
jgi:hypothetical protein